MDGIATSSFGGPAPRLFPPPSRTTPHSRLEAVVPSHGGQLSTKLAISHDGNGLARKTEAQREQLSRLDPKLVAHYRAVIDLLNQTNPGAVEGFFDFMDTVLDHADAPDAASPRVESPLPQELEIDIAVSVRVSAFVAEGQAGQVSVSPKSLDLNVQVRGERPAQKKVDPLVLDLDGDGVETSGGDSGVFFDIEANGNAALVSFVQGEDALLALDRNGNGVINDGGELFSTPHGANNGFAELKKFDDNRDGVIDAQDSVFSRLRGVRRNADGFALVSLARLGVREILTAYQDRQETLATGDEILQQGSFRYTTGDLGRAFDVGLSLRV